jgi:hypothetical protein
VTLVAYVSGHGLGHSAREVEILRHLPEDIPLVVKTSAPRWFWDTSLPRPFTYIPDGFDVGCVQKNGMEIDWGATLGTWHHVNVRNQGRLQAETENLKRCQARLVLTDVASFPLLVAQKAGVPSVCVANFTWADIYAQAGHPNFAPVAEQLQGEYAQATLLLEAGFALPMPYFSRRESVGVVARGGTDRRGELLQALPPEARHKRLALVYVGGWGLPIPYHKAEHFTDWHFLSLDAPPETPPNWSVLPRDLMPHPDFVASVDVVVSKPGYGIAGECVRNGIPLLYPPRPEFAEYHAFERDLVIWPGGFLCSLNDFLAVRWDTALERIPARGTIRLQSLDGAERAAALLTQLYRTGSR